MSQSDRSRDGVGTGEAAGGQARRGRWIGYAGSTDRLPADVRATVEEANARLAARRGRLLCEVTIAVYEGEAVPSVTFGPDAALEPDSGDEAIADAVARARDSLAGWR